MSLDSYIINAVCIVESYMTAEGTKIYKSTTPFHHQDYHPKLDDTPIVSPRMIARYQQLIGILHWGCELGRLDILLEVALMSAFNTAPRQGHLDQLYHIFSYLKISRACCIIFDPRAPTYDVGFCVGELWKEFFD